jgi:DNA-binding NtrC family response regulator
MSIILVIEDEPEILEVTSVLLKSSGYDVINARNAEEGIRVAGARDDIDVVFTDVNLGHGMSGTDLVDKLREQGSQAAMVVVSGDMDPFSGWTHPHAVFLPKPYGRRQLLTAIADARERVAQGTQGWRREALS